MTTTTTTKEVKWFAITLADISKTPRSKTAFMKSLVTSCMFRSTVQRQDKKYTKLQNLFLTSNLLVPVGRQNISRLWQLAGFSSHCYWMSPGSREPYRHYLFHWTTVWLRMCPTKWAKREMPPCFRTTLPIKPRVIATAAGQNLLQTSTSSRQGAQISSYLFVEWKTGEMITAIKIFLPWIPLPPFYVAFHLQNQLNRTPWERQNVLPGGIKLVPLVILVW